VARHRKGDAVHGWVLLDKPLGLSSAGAVARVKRIFNANKAGHAGTLDPLATGMLPIALGEATKTVPFIMDGAKVYSFTARWGAETTTDDLEGTITQTSQKRPTDAEIDAILPQFLGTISQLPPAFSAIKKDGVRAYELARAGENVELEPRNVEIFALKRVDSSPDEARFEVRCGKGTYVRALARDIARALGTAAHVSGLRREDVGPFRREHMILLENLADLAHKAPGGNAILSALHPLETALDDIPALALSQAHAARLLHGQTVILTGSLEIKAGTVLVTCGTKPVALAELNGSVLEPRRVFNL
jgi:tRNA pseudouridine55 synthase